MSVKSPAHITVALPHDVKPSFEMNEVLIRKFLKACKKENIQANVFDKSSMVRHFETPLRLDKIKRKRDKQRAIREDKAKNDPKFDERSQKSK